MSPSVLLPMEQSRTLMTALIHFVDDRLSLIQIPLKSYPVYIQSILQILHPTSPGSNGDAVGKEPQSSHDNSVPSVPWANQHAFLNISITPIECSIICSKRLADEYIQPVISRLGAESGATISPEDYVAISVEGEGLEAGQRVLELTRPLAMAGISIFFFTTYFSDYIAVPIKSRPQLIHALEDRGFTFDRSAHAYVNPSAHLRNLSSSSLDAHVLPPTPPPATLSELQSRTFSLLHRNSILPCVHESFRLVHCAGRSQNQEDLELQVGITKCLIHPSEFFSLTLTESEAPSLLLERNAISSFPADSLLGVKDDVLVPITLNLEPLPLEATGIVCGVASKLVGGGCGGVMSSVEMSYLSTARGAAVMVDERDLERATELLKESSV